MKMQEMPQIGKPRKSITGSTLKIIAIITMMIDHIGATILEKILMNKGFLEALTDMDVLQQFMIDNETLYLTYTLLRTVGRLAFPIFCFLLVEGFIHTRDTKKYAIRLGIFAFLSEIPFDLAFKGELLEFSYQNVFFTLFIGMLTMSAYKFVEDKEHWNKLLKIVSLVCILFIGTTVADILHTDYGSMGILAIMAIYICRKRKMLQIIAGCAVFMLHLQIPALLGFIPIALYRGEKGRDMKYFSYVFYPAHLFILYLIAFLMGLM